MILTHLKQIFNINSLNTTSKYFIWYYNLISKRLNNKHFENTYTEIHHWIPKCIGGNNEQTVRLTFREHFIAHLLLTKLCECSPYKNEIHYAFTCMSMASKHLKRDFSILNSRHFELIKRSRKIASKSIVRVKFKEKYTEQELKQKFGRLGAQNGMFNKTHSTEAKNSISKKNKGPNYKLKGKLLTEEHKNNIKKSKQNISEETKIKMKISAKKRGANNKIKYKILVIDKNTNQELLCCLYIPDCRILLNTIFNKNVKDGDIRACLCQTQKSAKGFIFKDLTNP